MPPKPLFSTFGCAIIFLSISGSVGAWPMTPRLSRSANLQQCRQDILKHTLAYEPYLVNINGERTFNGREAVGTDKSTCDAYCGSSSTPFHWSIFSPQFTGWLLPFLALAAQLPYESNGFWHNLMCFFLTVGSPPLAMYSLALTLLNSRYAKKLLDPLPAPKDAEKTLQFKELKTSIFQTFRISQQELFALAVRDGASVDDLTTLRAWWRSTSHSLMKGTRWFTVSLATQAAWAIVAFAFTWVDAFSSSNVGTNITAFGLAIALCWSWVTVVVLGWFFAGVSIFSSPMTDAIEQADSMHPNAFPRLATYGPPRNRQDQSHTVFTRRIAGDVEHPGPIYNYARVFVWSHMVYHVVEIIRQQGSRPQIEPNGQEDLLVEQHKKLKQATRQVQEEDEGKEEKKEEKTQQQGNEQGQNLQLPPTSLASDASSSMMSPISKGSVQEYCIQLSEASPNIDIEREENNVIIARYLWQDASTVALWKHDARERMLWAIASAILLNLMTVGSAFGLDFATPSIGLGCRSGGVLIYWMVSYIILIALVLAALISDSWSAREAKMRHFQTTETLLRRVFYRLLGITAVCLRLLGKLLACLNSTWIILHCLFEFTRFYDRCYCQTNRGTSFWLWLNDEETRSLGNTERFWLGFASATGITCLFYIAFMLAWTTKRL
ncbi:hypothetical protein FRB91_000607 [Serendipita sp. 411]|nr:hypothetical protein FRB91_000607 [Serendipita sp. 411]